MKRRSLGLFLLFAPQWGGNVNADESSDSVLTPPRTKIHACKVTKAAASLRKSSTREYCDGRVDRANTLNKIPLPRSLKKLPKDIFVDGIDDNVGLSLQSDWIFFVKRLWAMIIKAPQIHIVSLNYKFGKEEVGTNARLFAPYQLNYSIRLCIFGKDF